jgi:predicted PhzF superfamily epimerase YddE/YHI9
MNVELLLVDVFSGAPFQGAVTPVYILESRPPRNWMLGMTRELGFSDSAFVRVESPAFRVRTFTPGGEVDFSVRTLFAAAHALREAGRIDAGASRCRLRTRRGPFDVALEGRWLGLTLAADPVRRTPLPRGLGRALGLPLRRIWRNDLDYLAEAGSADELRNLTPDLEALARFECRGVIVTSPSESSRFDFLSRYFAPRSGIPEDAVTGSAHLALGQFWSERTGKRELVGRQVSARGGTVRVEVAGGLVTLLGEAVTSLRGVTAV